MKKNPRSFDPIWLRSLAAWLFFLLIASLMTWPLVLHLRTSIIGWLGDNVYFVWLYGWYQSALSNLPANHLLAQNLNYPIGWSLAYTEISSVNILTGLPFSLLAGPVFAYNVTLLISFVLSGWIVYRWVLSMGGSHLAGLVAGTIFTCAPFRLAHAYGHLQLMGTQWLALHYFGLYQILQKREFKWQYCLMAGLGIGLAGLSSMYYLYMGFVVSLCFVAAYLIFVDYRAVLQKNTLKSLSLALLIALPLMVLAVLPYLELAKLGMGNHRTLDQVDMFSASLLDFILPSPTHFIWGNWIDSLIKRPAWIEKYLYLGLVPMLLSVFAVFRIGKEGKAQSRTFLWLVICMAAALVLAMGTTLHITLDQFRLAHVPEILKKWSITAQGIIPLPNYFLFKYLPFYDGMRAWDRYGIFVSLFLAILAGLGFYLLCKKIQSPGMRMAVFCLAIALICVDYRINTPLSRLEARPVDLWLAAQPGMGSVVEFPVNESFQPVSIYGSLTHQKPMFGTFYGAYLPKNYEQILPELNQFPSEQGIQILKDRKVQYVLVDASKYADWPQVQNKLASAALDFKEVLGSIYIYEMK